MQSEHIKLTVNTQDTLKWMPSLGGPFLRNMLDTASHRQLLGVRAQTYTDDGVKTMEAKIDISQISRLLGVVDIVSVASGDFLFKEKDKADGFYIVRSGELQIIHGDIIYETIRAGDIVGEMAVVDETTRSASVLARTRAELVAVDSLGFLALVKDDPVFALTVMRVMSRRLRKMNRRYETAQTTHLAAC